MYDYDYAHSNKRRLGRGMGEETIRYSLFWLMEHFPIVPNI
jgi:hypothetical protein